LNNPTIFEEKDGALFKYVACGKDHVAAITTDGRLLTLGNGDKGKLGHKKFKDEYEDSRKVGHYRPRGV